MLPEVKKVLYANNNVFYGNVLVNFPFFYGKSCLVISPRIWNGYNYTEVPLYVMLTMTFFLCHMERNTVLSNLHKSSQASYLSYLFMAEKLSQGSLSLIRLWMMCCF